MGYEVLSPKVSLVTINSFSSAFCIQKSASYKVDGGRRKDVVVCLSCFIQASGM